MAGDEQWYFFYLLLHSNRVKPVNSYSAPDNASSPTENETRFNELSKTKLKRINAPREPQAGSFQVNMYFNG